MKNRIPYVAAKAGVEAWFANEHAALSFEERMNLAFHAMVKVWPGMLAGLNGYRMRVDVDLADATHILLPLQENANDKG